MLLICKFHIALLQCWLSLCIPYSFLVLDVFLLWYFSVAQRKAKEEFSLWRATCSFAVHLTIIRLESWIWSSTINITLLHLKVFGRTKSPKLPRFPVPWKTTTSDVLPPLLAHPLTTTDIWISDFITPTLSILIVTLCFFPVMFVWKLLNLS